MNFPTIELHHTKKLFEKSQPFSQYTLYFDLKNWRGILRMLVYLIPLNGDIRKQVKFPEILIWAQNKIIPIWFCMLDTTSVDISFGDIFPQLNRTLKFLNTKIKLSSLTVANLSCKMTRTRVNTNRTWHELDESSSSRTCGAVSIFA